MDKTRAEAFTDGVLAVAITLLVLDLHATPANGSLGHQLREEWPSFAAYATSFVVIGVMWVNHHAMFALAERVDRVLLFYNLLLLMFVAVLPFTTATLASFLREGGSDARWAVLLYGAAMEGTAIGFTLIMHRLVRAGLTHQPLSHEEGTRVLRRFGLGLLAYPVATLLGLLSAPLMLVGIAALALYYMFDQTPILPVSQQES